MAVLMGSNTANADLCVANQAPVEAKPKAGARARPKARLPKKSTAARASDQAATAGDSAVADVASLLVTPAKPSRRRARSKAAAEAAAAAAGSEGTPVKVVKPAAPDAPAADSIVHCVICVGDFALSACLQVKGCGHSFCHRCIRRWAQRCSQCPLCKCEMGSLGPLTQPGARGRKRKEREVPTKRLAVPAGDDSLPPGLVDYAEESDGEICEVCGSGHDEACMLLCDGCDTGYHTMCLHPPLTEIPMGLWHCPQCRPVRPKLVVGRPPGRSSYLGPGLTYDCSSSEETQPISGRHAFGETSAAPEQVATGSIVGAGPEASGAAAALADSVPEPALTASVLDAQEPQVQPARRLTRLRRCTT